MILKKSWGKGGPGPQGPLDPLVRHTHRLTLYGIPDVFAWIFFHSVPFRGKSTCYSHLNSMFCKIIDFTKRGHKKHKMYVLLSGLSFCYASQGCEMTSRTFERSQRHFACKDLRVARLLICQCQKELSSQCSCPSRPRARENYSSAMEKFRGQTERKLRQSDFGKFVFIQWMSSQRREQEARLNLDKESSIALFDLDKKACAELLLGSVKLSKAFRPCSHRMREQICTQICMQTLSCCMQPVWTLPFTTVCSIICMRMLQGAPRPVWTGPWDMCNREIGVHNKLGHGWSLGTLRCGDVQSHTHHESDPDPDLLSGV